MSDYHFGLSIELKDEKSKTSLLKSTMNSLLVALTAILQSLKTRFNDNLDRNLYLTLCHDDLASGVILGPRNLASDDIDKIAQEICANLEIPFYNITDISLEAETNKTLVADDGLHPSEKMYHRWVVRILPQVKALLNN